MVLILAGPGIVSNENTHLETSEQGGRNLVSKKVMVCVHISHLLKYERDSV